MADEHGVENVSYCRLSRLGDRVNGGGMLATALHEIRDQMLAQRRYAVEVMPEHGMINTNLVFFCSQSAVLFTGRNGVAPPFGVLLQNPKYRI